MNIVVSLEVTLSIGTYVIIPCTFAPNNLGNFTVNIKSQSGPVQCYLFPSNDNSFAECKSEWNSETAGKFFHLSAIFSAKYQYFTLWELHVVTTNLFTHKFL